MGALVLWVLGVRGGLTDPLTTRSQLHVRMRHRRELSNLMAKLENGIAIGVGIVYKVAKFALKTAGPRGEVMARFVVASLTLGSTLDLGLMYPMLFFFLVPMIPAIIFFVFIKSTAQVNGNLPASAGLLYDVKFQLGGAFGAYFVTVLLALATHSIWNPPPDAEVWHVTGTLVDNQGRPVYPYDMKEVSLYPSPLDPYPSGHFDIVYVVRPTDHRRKIYPAISFDYHEKFPLNEDVELSAPSISLDPAGSDAPKLSWDRSGQRVELGTISLKPLSSYNPSGPAITPLASAAAAPVGGPK
jgi:hypothetical protein